MLARYFLISLALAGCASSPTAPPLTAKATVVTVYQPVKVPCIDFTSLPAEPPTAMPDPSSSIKQLAAGAKLDLDAETRYSAELRASLTPCLKE